MDFCVDSGSDALWTRASFVCNYHVGPRVIRTYVWTEIRYRISICGGEITTYSELGEFLSANSTISICIYIRSIDAVKTCRPLGSQGRDAEGPERPERPL